MTDEEIRYCPTDEEIDAMPEGNLGDWVSKQIVRMKSMLKLGAGRAITLPELQEQLSNWSYVNFSLLLLKNEARIGKNKASALYKAWWSDKLIAVKLRENTKELSGTKWASATELEAMAIRENKAEYIEKVSEISDLEGREEFMDSLVKAWDKHLSALQSLSSNLRSEGSNRY